MKILVINQHYWPENFRVTEICEALVERGHDVTALVGLPNYPTGIIPDEYRHHQNRHQIRNGVHIERCFEIGRRQGKLGLAINYVSYMISASLKALFLKRDFDVIYSFSTSPVLMSLPAALLRCFTKKRFVIYILDIWPACLAAMNIGESSVLYRFMKLVSKWIYQKADVRFYSSKSFQGYLLDVHGIEAPDECHLPQFADDIFEHPLPPKSDNDIINLVFTGNIGKMQGVETLIHAASLLREYPIRWHFVGDGSNEESCKKLVHQLDLEKAIFFYGRKPLEEMPKFYEMADALLVSMRKDSSVNDTLPGKVQSYMAAGRPLLGSIAGETSHVIRDANCGYCVEPDIPEAFATIVKQFIENDNHQQMADNARAYYEKHFTKKQHIDQLEQTLLKLAEG